VPIVERNHSTRNIVVDNIDRRLAEVKWRDSDHGNDIGLGLVQRTIAVRKNNDSRTQIGSRSSHQRAVLVSQCFSSFDSSERSASVASSTADDSTIDATNHRLQTSLVVVGATRRVMSIIGCRRTNSFHLDRLDATSIEPDVVRETIEQRRRRKQNNRDSRNQPARRRR
jgi:hypothetical protein